MKKSRKRPKTHQIQHLGGSTALSGYQTSFPPLTYSASPSTPSASHLYSQPTPKISTPNSSMPSHHIFNPNSRSFHFTFI
ncbi:hypothetical protein ACE6H2_015257 [Prunus campanulata]